MRQGKGVRKELDEESYRWIQIRRGDLQLSGGEREGCV